MTTRGLESRRGKALAMRWSLTDAVRERAAVKAKLHGLRHTATFQAGADLKAVLAKDVAAHKLSTTNDVYVEVFDTVRRGTADRTNSVLRKISGSNAT